MERRQVKDDEQREPGIPSDTLAREEHAEQKYMSEEPRGPDQVVCHDWFYEPGGELEDDGRSPLVGADALLGEATLFGDPDGRPVVGMNEADEIVRAKVLSTPLQRCLGSFGCIPLTVFRRSKDPAQFRDGSKRRFDVALEIPEANLTHKVSCCFLLHHPIAKAENRPMAEITEKAGPALLHCKRLAPHDM